MRPLLCGGHGYGWAKELNHAVPHHRNHLLVSRFLLWRGLACECVCAQLLQSFSIRLLTRGFGFGKEIPEFRWCSICTLAGKKTGWIRAPDDRAKCVAKFQNALFESDFDMVADQSRAPVVDYGYGALVLNGSDRTGKLTIDGCLKVGLRMDLR